MAPGAGERCFRRLVFAVAQGARALLASTLLHQLVRWPTLNHMVQYRRAHLDTSFAALSDATRRGVLEQLGRADASITYLAEKFHIDRKSTRLNSSHMSIS